MEEFFDLKLGSMTMEDYEKKFLEILNYADFIKDEKVKIQRFLSGLPEYYRDKINMIDQGTLRIPYGRKKHLYEDNASKAPYENNWKDMKKNKQA